MSRTVCGALLALAFTVIRTAAAGDELDAPMGRVLSQHI
jgi:hypothetical protein